MVGIFTCTPFVVMLIAAVVTKNGLILARCVNCPEDVPNFSNYRQIWDNYDITLLDYLKFENYTGNAKNCYNDLKNTVFALFKGEKWALSMLDAFGKPGAGIMDGNTIWAGSYKQCLSANNNNFSGRFCWLRLPLNKYSTDWNQTFSKLSRNSFRTAICVPDSCDSENIQQLVNLIKKRINELIDWIDLIPVNIKCFEDDEKNLLNDPLALIAGGICCTILMLMAIGTYLDMQNKSHKKLSFSSQLFICFSIYSNGKKLFTLEHSKNSIPEINGIKTLAATLVIFGNTYLLMWRIVDNPLEMGQVLTYWYFQFPAHFDYMVDVFIAITGFLTLNSVLSKFIEPKCNISNSRFIFYYTAHRYWRLALTAGILLFVFRIGLLSYLNSGPFWENLDPYCRINWWQNMLFISNWWPLDKQCYATWWYMSVSMQLHLLALIVIVPLLKKKYYLAIFNGSAMLFLSSCWVGWTSFSMDIPPTYSTLKNKDFKDYFNQMLSFKHLLYMNPFYHLGAFLSGMLTSWIIYKYKDKIKLNKVQLFCGWCLFSVLMVGTVYLIYFEPNKMLKSLNTALSVTIWGLGFAWVIIVSYTKNGGIISTVLSWKCWLPFSKLTLTFYLIQITVIEIMCFAELVPIHFSEYSFFGLFLRHWFVAFVLAIPVSLAFEAPVFAIEKLIEKQLFSSGLTKVKPN